MTLEDLLKRYYFIVGDNIDDPREFDRTRAIDLINEGNKQFRRHVEDTWYRVDIPAVANQDIYDIPDNIMRILRIAWDDYTMRPRMVQEWVALDDRWQTRTFADPFEWSNQGVGHDQVRVYPKPSTSTSQGLSVSGETGTIIRWDESGDAVFSSELGIVVEVETVQEFVGELGTEQNFSQSDVKQFTFWGVQKVAGMQENGETVPVKNAYQKVGLWYALWQTYEEEGDHHNAALAGYYKGRFENELQRGRRLADRPLPWYVVKLGHKGSRRGNRSYLPFDSEMTVDGLGTISVGWPKRGYWS